MFILCWSRAGLWGYWWLINSISFLQGVCNSIRETDIYRVASAKGGGVKDGEEISLVRISGWKQMPVLRILTLPRRLWRTITNFALFLGSEWERKKNKQTGEPPSVAEMVPGKGEETWSGTRWRDCNGDGAKSFKMIDFHISQEPHEN